MCQKEFCQNPIRTYGRFFVRCIKTCVLNNYWFLYVVLFILLANTNLFLVKLKEQVFSPQEIVRRNRNGGLCYSVLLLGMSNVSIRLMIYRGVISYTVDSLIVFSKIISVTTKSINGLRLLGRTFNCKMTPLASDLFREKRYFLSFLTKSDNYLDLYIRTLQKPAFEFVCAGRELIMVIVQSKNKY